MVYLESYRTEREAGEKTVDAYRVALQGVMTSWIDGVEYGKFGRATVTATLFGGMDESLYTDFKKGGSSLSEVFKVIERFSEDIDVSIDRGFLGFDGPNELEAGSSNKERQRRIEALRTACQQSIADKLKSTLTAAIKSKLRSSETWSLRADDEDPDWQTLLFEYPSSVTSETGGYVPRLVKGTSRN